MSHAEVKAKGAGSCARVSEHIHGAGTIFDVSCEIIGHTLVTGVCKGQGGGVECPRERSAEISKGPGGAAGRSHREPEEGDLTRGLRTDNRNRTPRWTAPQLEAGWGRWVRLQSSSFPSREVVTVQDQRAQAKKGGCTDARLIFEMGKGGVGEVGCYSKRSIPTLPRGWPSLRGEADRLLKAAWQKAPHPPLPDASSEPHGGGASEGVWPLWGLCAVSSQVLSL